MAEANPSEVFEATYESGNTGLAGNLAVAINDNQNVVVFGPTTLGIVELLIGGQPTGTYRAMLTAPAVEGQYAIQWSEDGSFDPDIGFGTEDLLVATSTFDLPSLGGGVDSVLCSSWTTAEDLVMCCDAEFDSDGILTDSAIVAASEVLYLASGKQYPGLCTASNVRPCQTDNCGCGFQVLSRGHLVNWREDCWGGYACGCRATSRVKLAGRVNEIISVTIDGVTVDPDQYFVYENVYLTRKSPNRWPSCQSMDLDPDEPGTFAVTYTYGKAPPVIGQLAAQDLACEIIKSCTPGVECAIPNGVTRITRQGITIERGHFIRDKKTGVWATGIGSVDYFLNGVNPKGLQRRAVGWNPNSRSRYARPGPT